MVEKANQTQIDAWNTAGRAHIARLNQLIAVMHDTGDEPDEWPKDPRTED